jgi:hypothetical protein
VSAIVTATMVALAASAHADPDADFANQLHGYGIYGPPTTTHGWAKSRANDCTTA